MTSAEEQAKKDAEEQAKKDAEEQAKKDAKEQARREKVIRGIPKRTEILFIPGRRLTPRERIEHILLVEAEKDYLNGDSSSLDNLRAEIAKSTGQSSEREDRLEQSPRRSNHIDDHCTLRYCCRDRVQSNNTSGRNPARFARERIGRYRAGVAFWCSINAQ